MNNLFLLSLLSILLLTNCEEQKECCAFPVGERADIFLLSSYQEDLDSPFRTITSYELENTPIIAYEDIVFYNDETYEMKVQGASLNRLKDIKKSEPFALKVDKEIIYFGWFWPAFLSSSCICIVVDPLRASFSDTIRFDLGYGIASDLREIDKRNEDFF